MIVHGGDNGGSDGGGSHVIGLVVVGFSTSAGAAAVPDPAVTTTVSSMAIMVLWSLCF